MPQSSSILSSLLQLPYIKIRDIQAVDKKLRAIHDAGPKNLYIISDFDATLSKHHQQSTPNEKLPGSYGVVEQYTQLPQKTKDLVTKNFEYYYPMEMDVSIPADQKTKLMIEWYKSSMAAIVESGELTQQRINDGAKISPCVLRDDTDKLLCLSNELKIPFLIFSAGCGNAIHGVLKSRDTLCWYEENMLVVANMLDTAGKSLTEPITGWKKPLIHSMNKNDFFQHVHELKESNLETVLDLVNNRSNIILMGDHLGDVRMSEGIQSAENVLTLGFLNNNLEKNLSSYMDAFDMVLVDDQTMNVPLDIMKSFTAK